MRCDGLVKLKRNNMKNLLLILLVASNTGHAQNIAYDSVIKKSACLIRLTDSSNQIYDMPLKMHIGTRDMGDSINGAVFTYTLYSVGASPTTINTNSIGITGAYYTAWDANDDKATYQFVQAALASQGIIILFQ